MSVIYKCQLVGQFNSGAVQTINSFDIETTGADPGATPTEILRNIGHGLWKLLLLAGLQTLTSVLQVFVKVIITEISGGSNPGLTAEYAIPIGEGLGGSSSDPGSPFDAFGLRFTAGDGGFRHGYKRFPGVSEGFEQLGHVFGGATTLLPAIGAALLTNWNSVNDAGSNVVTSNNRYVLRKARSHGMPVTPVQYSRPVAVTVMDITTQNTRKYGRGA
jgi:hypothetical protein